jgi:hypothetical protein
MASPLAQHDRVGESSAAGRDMHWGSTREIETSHLEDPSGGVPGPACNRVVDDGGPDEHEYHAREHATTLGDRSHGKRNRDRCEHALVDGEQQIRDLRRSDGRGTENISEANVFQIADKFPPGVREGEGVAPEEPLEGDDGGGHDGEPYQGQGRLPPSETRIEESVHTPSAPVSLGIHVFRVCAYPTPGIMRSTRAVAVMSHAISPG